MTYTFKSLFTESNATNKTSYYFMVNQNIRNDLNNLNEYILQVSRLIIMKTKKMDVNNEGIYLDVRNYFI